MPQPDDTLEFSINELSERSGISVRNIRAYRQQGLLPAPEKRGRRGIYSALHLARLETITSLLARGYSATNIAELISAWQSGQGIDSILGMESMLRAPFPAEQPQLFNLGDLQRKFGPALTPRLVRRAVSMGLVRPQGLQFVAPRPRMIEIGVELTRLGIPLSDLLDVLDSVRPELDLAAEHIIDRLGRTQPGGRRGADARQLTATINRIRQLIDAALLSELGQAMELAATRRFGDAMSLRRREP